VTALREKYFNEAEVNVKDFEDWKPDEVHEIHAKTWESVDINCLPSILVIGIYPILTSKTDGGDFISTKLNDIFDFPVVSSKSLCSSLLTVIRGQLYGTR
jgi:hypothetical protein